MKEKQQISIATSFDYDTPIDRQLALIAGAGFSHISIGVRPEHSGYLDASRRGGLTGLLADHGLAVDSVHARRLDDPDALPQATASAEAAAELGAKCVVAHVGPFHCKLEGIVQRLVSITATCEALVPVAKATGVTFALENVMPGPATDMARRVLQDLDPAVFGLCYDSSHDQIDGPRPFDLIHEFAGRIFAVHLSDRIREHVDHVIPGEGFIAWTDMCTSLRSAHFTGPILMEVMMTNSRFRPADEFLRQTYEAAIRTWKAINNGASNQPSEAIGAGAPQPQR